MHKNKDNLIWFELGVTDERVFDKRAFILSRINEVINFLEKAKYFIVEEDRDSYSTALMSIFDARYALKCVPKKVSRETYREMYGTSE